MQKSPIHEDLGALQTTLDRKDKQSNQILFIYFLTDFSITHTELASWWGRKEQGADIFVRNNYNILRYLFSIWNR